MKEFRVVLKWFMKVASLACVAIALYYYVADDILRAIYFLVMVVLLSQD